MVVFGSESFNDAQTALDVILERSEESSGCANEVADSSYLKNDVKNLREAQSNPAPIPASSPVNAAPSNPGVPVSPKFCSLISRARPIPDREHPPPGSRITSSTCVPRDRFSYLSGP